MVDPSEKQLLEAVHKGDENAFARLYDLYHERVRLAAWRVTHRPDWLDEIVNESWCRAFAARKSYDPARPFLVWIAGIVQNVYREQCRKSPLTLSAGPREDSVAETGLDPEEAAAEAEALSVLNECIGRLSAEDAVILRLRYFEDKPLRLVAEEVNVAESTLRAVRLPEILERLRRCMKSKGLEIPSIFSAQGPTEMQ